MNTKKGKASSPKTTGGAGFNYESYVAVYYLACMLAEIQEPASTIDNCKKITSVRLQQGTNGRLLDDICLDIKLNNDSITKIDFQVKTTIKITEKFPDFTEPLIQAFESSKEDTYLGVGLIGQNITTSDNLKALHDLIDRAKASLTTDDFLQRFKAQMSQTHIAVWTIICNTIRSKYTNACDEQIFYFMKKFIIAPMCFSPEQGGHDKARVLDILKGILVNPQDALNLFDTLLALVRKWTPDAGILDRNKILDAISGQYNLKILPRYEQDFQKINQFSNISLNSIIDNINNIHIPCDDHIKVFNQATVNKKNIVITGLPGVGKSVFLKKLAKHYQENAYIIVFKNGYFSGKNIHEFANGLGLSLCVNDIFNEMNNIKGLHIFIDGIDMLSDDEKQIIASIINIPKIKIIATARKNNFDDVKKLFSDIIYDEYEFHWNGEKTEYILNNTPELKKLYHNVNKKTHYLLNRPFFLKILSDNIKSIDPNTLPTDELDCINLWSNNIKDGLSTLSDIAYKVSCNPNAKPIVEDSNRTIINHLISANILNWSNIRKTNVEFSHDIFQEWALFNYFRSGSESGESVQNILKGLHSFYQLKRVFEFWSQSEYLENHTDWNDKLQILGQDNAIYPHWLLAPALNTKVRDTQFDVYLHTLSENNFNKLGDVLNFMKLYHVCIISPQELKMLPIQPESSVTFLDDCKLWFFILKFTLDNIHNIPEKIYPKVIDVYKIWIYFSKWVIGEKNYIDTKMVAFIYNFLTKNSDDEYWEYNIRDIRNEFLHIFFTNYYQYPDDVSKYLDYLLETQDLDDSIFQNILIHSSHISQNHPEKLVDLSIKALCDDLPLVKIEKSERRYQEQIAYRNDMRQRQKEGKLSDRDKKCLALSSPLIRGNANTWHDWSELSINKSYANWYPSHPLREPFKSLFEYRPNEAFRLIREILNHATTAWQQMHGLSLYESRGMPIPITLDFPFGKQSFYGTDKTYLWGRGFLAPQPIETALLALDKWVDLQIDQGQDIDELIQMILQGQNSVAILCIAVGIILRTQHISDVTLPIITNQRLLNYDLRRWVEDKININHWGFKTREDIGFKELSDINQRWRKYSHLRDHVTNIGLIFNKKYSEKIADTVKNFPNNLPFEFEDERGNQAYKEKLLKQAKIYAEFGKIENYKPIKYIDQNDKTKILGYSYEFTNNSQEAKQDAPETELSNKVMVLLNHCTDIFKHNCPPENFDTNNFLSILNELYDKNVLTSNDDEHILLKQALPASAVVILNYREQFKEDSIALAKDIILSLKDISIDNTYQYNTFINCSTIPYCPHSFVVRAIASDIKYHNQEHDKLSLLSYLLCPNEEVYGTALYEAIRLYDTDKKLTISAINILLELCDKHNIELDRVTEIYKTDSLSQIMLQLSHNYQTYYNRATYVIKAITEYALYKKHDLQDSISTFLKNEIKDLQTTNESCHNGLSTYVHSLATLIALTYEETHKTTFLEKFIKPILSKDNETQFNFFWSFVGTFVNYYICNKKILETETINFLYQTYEIIIQADFFRKQSMRSIFARGHLLKGLFFLFDTKYGGSFHFANDDYSNIHCFYNHIDFMVKSVAVTKNEEILYYYLNLCKKLTFNYPLERLLGNFQYLIEKDFFRDNKQDREYQDTQYIINSFGDYLLKYSTQEYSEHQASIKKISEYFIRELNSEKFKGVLDKFSI